MNELSPARPIRVRHQNKSGLVEVTRVEPLTPHMRRIVLSGDVLEGFTTAAADDHVKLFFPAPGETRPSLPVLGPNGPVFPEGAIRPAARDYTPRRFNPATRELSIDFVIHGDGPASSWAEQAGPGQVIGIGGPRGSFLNFDTTGSICLLIGDETALPAIGRRLEELPPGSRAIALIEVEDEAETLALPSAGNLRATWLFRRGAAPGTADRLLPALRDTCWTDPDIGVWIAGEIAMVRALRDHLIGQRGLPRAQVKAAGYWKAGEPGAHTKLED